MQMRAAAGLMLAALAMQAAVPFSAAFGQEKAAPKAGRTTKPESAPTPANIDRNGVLILVRSTLLALDHANRTGNYTVLRDLGARGFQANTASRLAEIFAGQRADGLDLGGVAVLEPQLTLLPQIEPNGMLHMAGFFPSVPSQVSFEMLFQAEGGEWKLFGISASVGKAGPHAPSDEPQPVPVQVPEKEPAPPTTRIGPKEDAKPASK